MKSLVALHAGGDAGAACEQSVTSILQAKKYKIKIQEINLQTVFK